MALNFNDGSRIVSVVDLIYASRPVLAGSNVLIQV